MDHRLFGTLRDERDGIKIIYGIALDQPQNFNPLYHQVFFNSHCIAGRVLVLCYLRFHFSHGRIMFASIPSFLVFLLSMCQVEAGPCILE